MKKTSNEILLNLIIKYPALKQCEGSIKNAVKYMISCYENLNKILVCGNGGSAADSEHIVGELMKGFLLDRKVDDRFKNDLLKLFPDTAEYLIQNLQKSLSAISLVSQTSLMTAYSNDKAPDVLFAQQVYGYGKSGDVLIAISTSGNSKNVVYAAQTAKIQGLKIIALTGESGGRLKDLADVLINVPSELTYEIQEYHLPVYHALCAAVENEFFAEEE